MTPGVDQVHYAVGEHLGVHAQVLLVPQRIASTAFGVVPYPTWSVEPSSTSSLEVPADAGQHLRVLLPLLDPFQDGLVALHQVIDLADMCSKAVPLGAGHVGVHLGDDDVRVLRCALGDVHADAQ